MSQPEDISICYTRHGFLYQFNANFDFLLNNWNVSFLVYHVNDEQIYLGEYSRFRRKVLYLLNKMDDLEHKSKIIDELNYKYVSVISSYIYSYISRIRNTKPADISLCDYARQKIDKFIELISILKVNDLTATKLDQKNAISFFFVWNGIITASYRIYKNTDQDYFSSDY